MKFTLCGRQYSLAECNYIFRLCARKHVGLCDGCDIYDAEKAAGGANLSGYLNITPELIVQAIVNGAEFIRLKLAAMRIDLSNAIAAYATNPYKFGCIIVGILAASVTLNMLYTYLKTDATFMAVQAFLISLWQTILTIGSFLQVDVLITMAELGAIFLDTWRNQLTKIYTALGSLSEEIGKDISFIMVFTETNRAIIHSLYSLSGNSWLKAEYAYAQSMQAFLGGLKAKFNDYMLNPELIFLDLQTAIAEAARTETDERVAGIFAAISLVADAAKKTGNELIDLLDELDDIKKNAPLEIQAAMDVWYKPFREDYEKFLKDKWGPFWEKTNSAMETIERLIEAHGIDIEEIKRTIETPYDFFMVIFGLPTEAQAAEIKRTRDIMLKLLEDTTVDADAFGNAHRSALAASADPLEVAYQPAGPSYTRTESYRVPASLQTDQNDSWYRGAY